jgi:K+/H+ antiporter YhaU regulatory subunit KhtT
MDHFKGGGSAPRTLTKRHHYTGRDEIISQAVIHFQKKYSQFISEEAVRKAWMMVKQFEEQEAAESDILDHDLE